MNETPFDKAAQEAATLQRIWLENLTKALQTAFKFTPDSAPPDIMRQVRTGMFQALTESWDEFMRSPQFLECMRQWMDNAVTLRTMTNEFLGRMRNEAQAPSRSDIDTIMLAVRHMEKRLLDRLDDLSAQVAKANGNGTYGASAPQGRRKSKAAGSPARQRRTEAQK